MDIRILKTVDEIRPCEELQVAIWHMPDAQDAVPAHQLFTAAKYGGMVLGAFDGDRLIGLAYGFVGLYRGRPILCSHMNGVLPEYRGQGIGYALKVQQRLAALERGLEAMHWTYDPMELVNGNLNIRRLGGTSRLYEPNLYGTMSDGLNAGLPTDRLVVEWDLTAARVHQALMSGAAPAPERAECFAYDGTTLPAGGQALALTLPKQFQQIKRTDPREALRWRLAARRAFVEAFAAGYRLTGADADGYIFTREP